MKNGKGRKMEVKLICRDELSACEKIYSDARGFMRECGNGGQWGNSYPPREQIVSDIERGALYGIYELTVLVGVFYFAKEREPSYTDIYSGSWLSDGEYGVIHRVAVSSAARGRGVVRTCFDFCKGMCDSLRIDTHEDNIPMQSALSKAGFVKCGKIMLARGGERIAYQWVSDL